MTKKINLPFILLLLISVFSVKGQSQNNIIFSGKFFAQSWLKFSENNRGSADQYGVAKPHSTDFILRRIRFIGTVDVSNKDIIFTHVGTNGIYSGAKSPNITMHEIWYKRILIEKEDFVLNLGVGQHFWNGVSRMSNLSLVEMITSEFPISVLPFIGNRSEIGRQIGIFSHGKIYRLSYRVSMNSPFEDNTSISGHMEDDIRSLNMSSLAYTGYFYYHFLDKEKQRLPYIASSYYGEKQIFNVGFGYYYHPNSIGIFENNTPSTRANQLTIAGDIFYDHSLTKNSEINVYALFQQNFSESDYYVTHRPFSSNYGPYQGYSGAIPTSGFGNAQPLMGTGTLLLFQIAYHSRLDEKTDLGIQPYINYTLKNINLISRQIDNWIFGLSIFPSNNSTKFSLEYSLRPEVINRDQKVFQDAYAKEIVFNFQIFI